MMSYQLSSKAEKEVLEPLIWQMFLKGKVSLKEKEITIPSFNQTNQLLARQVNHGSFLLLILTDQTNDPNLIYRSHLKQC